MRQEFPAGSCFARSSIPCVNTRLSFAYLFDKNDMKIDKWNDTK